MGIGDVFCGERHHPTGVLRAEQGSGAGWEVSWLAESLAIRFVFPRKADLKVGLYDCS
jgi:hypothetical protein